LKSLYLIQVGDIHFPEARKKAELVDFKDRGMSAALTGPMIGNSLQQMARQADALRDSHSAEMGALLLCLDPLISVMFLLCSLVSGPAPAYDNPSC
jgi:hypothetical protein